MYKRLLSEMVLRGISRRMMAAGIGISYEALCLKLLGKSHFTYGEAIKAKEFIGFDGSVEDLMQRS